MNKKDIQKSVWDRAFDDLDENGDPIEKPRTIKSDASVNRARANRIKAQDPKWLEKVKEAGENLKNNPEWQEQQKLRAEKRSQDLELKEKLGNLSRQLAKTEEWKIANQKGAEKRKNDPVWRENNAKANKLSALDPARSLKLSNKLKGKPKSINPWDDPEYRQNQMSIIADPEFKKRKSEIGKIAQGKLETKIKHGKAFITPYGAFYARKEASEYFSSMWDVALCTAATKVLEFLRDDNNLDWYYIDSEEYKKLISLGKGPAEPKKQSYPKDKKVYIRPIHTPEGIFINLIEAAKNYNKDKDVLYYWLKVKASEFYYLSKEDADVWLAANTTK